VALIASRPAIPALARFRTAGLLTTVTISLGSIIAYLIYGNPDVLGWLTKAVETVLIFAAIADATRLHTRE
jgi:hypothetical protein